MDDGDGSGAVALPRLYLKPCLLLLLAEGPAHGYGLLERVGGLGWKRTEFGNVYRLLRTMEHEGLVDSVWQRSDVGPARRMYAISPYGVESLHGWAGIIREMTGLVDGLLRRYEALGPAPAPRI